VILKAAPLEATLAMEVYTVKNTFLNIELTPDSLKRTSFSAPASWRIPSDIERKAPPTCNKEEGKHSRYPTCDKQHFPRIPRERTKVHDGNEPKRTLPSIGSAGHTDGTCRPCAHFWRGTGCTRDKDCEYCHLCGEDEFSHHTNRRKALKKQRQASWRYLTRVNFGGTTENNVKTMFHGGAKADTWSSGPTNVVEAEDTETAASEAGSQSVDLCPSRGSAGHHAGTCRPCAHIWKQAGCSKGLDCEFCHLCGQQEFAMHKKQRAARARWMGSWKKHREHMGEHVVCTSFCC